MSRKSRAKPPSPFRCFNSSPEVIRLVVMMYVRFPLSLQNVENLLVERGMDICHKTVRLVQLSLKRRMNDGPLTAITDLNPAYRESPTLLPREAA